jgi:hypothetical protein
MSYHNSFIVEDCNQSNRLSFDCDSELFESILSDVDSIVGSKTDQELIGYLQGSSEPSPSHPSKSIVHSGRAESMCMSRNAVLARENRQKKKKYVQSLEKTLKNLNDQNSNLKLKTEAMAGRISDLASEVEYLKGVIANQSTLSRLIGSVCTTPGVRFYSSFTLNNNTDQTDDAHVDKESVNEPKRRSSNVLDDENQENATPKKFVRKSTRCVQSNKHYSATSINESLCEKLDSENKKNGICLHVGGDSVSLEFCSMCSKSASKTRRAAVTSGDHTYGIATEQN